MAFKKGQSGNPGGRPKNAPATLVRRMLSESGGDVTLAQQLKTALITGVWPVEVDEIAARRKGLSGKDMVLDANMRMIILKYAYPQPKESVAEDSVEAQTLMNLLRAAEEHNEKTGTDG